MSVKTEGFFGFKPPRTDFRRPFSDGSATIDTNDLAASLVPAYQFNYDFNENPEPPVLPEASFEAVERRSQSSGKAPSVRSKAGRKLSMTDPRPVRMTGPRTMSFSQDRVYNSWELPSGMQSFGSTAEDAFLDSPVTPALELDEQSKKQRRRECHNQVEKRRREHINAKIDELSRLLPAQYNQDLVEEEEEDGKKKRSSSAAKKDIQCKGRILTQSVKYISDMQQINAMQAARIQELEMLANGFQPFWRPSPEPTLHAVWQPFDESNDNRGRQRRRDEQEVEMGDLDTMFRERW